MKAENVSYYGVDPILSLYKLTRVLGKVSCKF